MASTEDGDKAIEIHNSLISQSGSSQYFCYRALCFSQQEQHDRVIEDCDRALQLDPALIQAHILKVQALTAIGKKEDALFQWEQGYKHALGQSADTQQLLELKEQLKSAKEAKNIIDGDHGSTMTQAELNSHHNGNLSETLTIKDKLSAQTELCGPASDVSESHDKTSINGNDSIDIAERRDEPGKNEKFCVAQVSESMSVDLLLDRGVRKTNEGEYDHAITIFNQILKEEPPDPDEALIGRGTAYAYLKEADAAIADFTKAILYNPLAWKAWMRRGQARAFLGKYIEAIGDLTKALKIKPSSTDILNDRGYVNLKLRRFDAAVEDFSDSIKLDQNNKYAHYYLGTALASIGQYEKAKEAHVKSLQLDRNFLRAYVKLNEVFYALVKPEKAQENLNRALEIDGRFLRAYYMRGRLFYDMGEHREAINDLTKGLNIDGADIEFLYLRASCYHAVGKYKEAVKDYAAALDLQLNSTVECLVHTQRLAFYQKEIALYTASKLDQEFRYFDVNVDIPLRFKEYWCNIWPYDTVHLRQPSLRSLRGRGKGGKLTNQDISITEKKRQLIRAADSIGKKIQYDCPGFLPNRREHRMAGFAAIEIAQKISKAWRPMKPKHSKRVDKSSQNRGGAGCSTRATSSETSSWQDIYSVAVKWKQIYDPCDPVVWVNKLSDYGFRSYKPMIFEQAQVVCYYPNYERTLNVAKAVMKERPYVFGKNDVPIDLSEDGKLEDIMLAKSCSDLYRVVGEDFCLPTWCNSTAPEPEGKELEGTRICLANARERGFDFSIQTRCTRKRSEDFDKEMGRAWEAICNAYRSVGENNESSENLVDAILRMTYYWHNYMPLPRGSDVVGLTVMLGLLLAANMKFTGNIPQGIQVDWEAILNFDSSSFVKSIKSWLYPSLQVTTSWKKYPDVASIFPTVGSVIGALNATSNDDQ